MSVPRLPKSVSLRWHDGRHGHTTPRPVPPWHHRCVPCPPRFQLPPDCYRRSGGNCSCRASHYPDILSSQSWRMAKSPKQCCLPYYIGKVCCPRHDVWKYNAYVPRSSFCPHIDRGCRSSMYFPHGLHKCHRCIPVGKVG